MSQKVSETDGDSCFAPVERESYDIEAALDDPDIETGRSGQGIVSIGLFGGEPTTSDPEDISPSEDGGRGLNFVRKVARATNTLDDFSGDVRFPKKIDDAIFSSSSLSDPFGAYRFTFYLGDLDHRAHQPVIDGLTEYFETEHEGNFDIRAIEFDYDHVDPKEKFRAVFPWAKRGKILSQRDNIDGYDLPTPIRHLASDLRSTPIECRDYRSLTITVHYYNSHKDRDGRYDREFTLEDCYGADETRLVKKDRRTPLGKALDSATISTQNTTVSYELDISIAHEEMEAIINDKEGQSPSTPDGVARRLGHEHHSETYAMKATVGVVSQSESDDGWEFKLAIQSAQQY